MDYVLTYVDGNDPIWQESYYKQKKENSQIIGTEPARFRDWGLLKYHFRGIEKNLPWIHNVFLVVSSDSQVPDWVNRNTVKVITHDQIIPNSFLPTFNSCTIEMFLKNIPNLGEYFIYANDDVYPLNRMEESDFLVGNKCCIHLNKKRLQNAVTQFRRVVVSCQNLIINDYSISKYPRADLGYYYRPEHFSLCHSKQTHQEVWKNHRQQINASISQFRKEKNYNQYIFTYQQQFSGKSIDKCINGSYYDFKGNNEKEIEQAIVRGDCKEVCINDNSSTPEYSGKKLKECFEIKFPNKSKYEV